MLLTLKIEFRKEKGVWIMHIVFILLLTLIQKNKLVKNSLQLKGSLAEADGRLKVNDRILEINFQNIKHGTKEEALKIIGVIQPFSI